MQGCTNCLKRCPTEAIRIRDGHAVITRMFASIAASASAAAHIRQRKPTLTALKTSTQKYRIALPAPSFYGQFADLDDVDFVLQGLLDIGFDDVFEAARAAEIVTEYTRRYARGTSAIL